MTRTGWQVFVSRSDGLAVSYLRHFTTEDGYPVIYQTREEAEIAVDTFIPFGVSATFIILPVTRKEAE